MLGPSPSDGALGRRNPALPRVPCPDDGVRNDVVPVFPGFTVQVVAVPGLARIGRPAAVADTGIGLRERQRLRHGARRRAGPLPHRLHGQGPGRPLRGALCGPCAPNQTAPSMMAGIAATNAAIT